MPKQGRRALWPRGAGAAVLACSIVVVEAWLCGSAIAGAPAGVQKAEQKIAWGTRRDKAADAARRNGKPLLMYFSAAWCGPCKEMEASLWSRPDVIAMSGNFVCLHIDVDSDPSLAQRYQADSLPTVSIADPWGTELARREGYGKPDEYVALLKSMPTDFREVAPWQERLAANPRDAEALHQAGLAYHHLNMYATSNEFLEKALASKELKAKPDLRADTLTMVGWNYLKSRDLERARESFEQVLEEAPSHQPLDVTLYGLVAVHLASGQSDKAAPYLGRLETCCPGSPFTARAREDLAAPPAPSGR